MSVKYSPKLCIIHTNYVALPRILFDYQYKVAYVEAMPITSIHIIKCIFTFNAYVTKMQYMVVKLSCFIAFLCKIHCKSFRPSTMLDAVHKKESKYQILPSFMNNFNFQCFDHSLYPLQKTMNFVCILHFFVCYNNSFFQDIGQTILFWKFHEDLRTHIQVIDITIIHINYRKQTFMFHIQQYLNHFTAFWFFVDSSVPNVW